MTMLCPFSGQPGNGTQGGASNRFGCESVVSPKAVRVLLAKGLPIVALALRLEVDDENLRKAMTKNNPSVGVTHAGKRKDSRFNSWAFKS